MNLLFLFLFLFFFKFRYVLISFLYLSRKYPCFLLFFKAVTYKHVDIVSGESIPIRLFLSPYELTPTHRNINNKFSVKYYLNLVLVDEEDRRYFKQQEITIYRLQESS